MTKIRKATLFDLPVLWDLWVKLTSEEAANEAIAGREIYPSPLLSEKDAWGLDTAVTLGNPGVLYLIAEKDGAAVGFMVTSICTRPVGHPTIYAHVHQLYVRPSERKRALGDVAETLCKETEEWVREHDVAAVEIDCVESNRGLWEKRGFTAAAHRMFRILENENG